MEAKVSKVRVIIVGEARVGKTSLLKTFMEGKFPSKIQAGSQEIVVNKKYTVNGKEKYFEFKDLAEEFETGKDTLNADLFLVCFSLNDNKSL